MIGALSGGEVRALSLIKMGSTAQAGAATKKLKHPAIRNCFIGLLRKTSLMELMC